MFSLISKAMPLLAAVALIAGCGAKKKAPSFYVEPAAESEKAKLLKGDAYRGKDGKLYLPIKAGKPAPKPANGQENLKIASKPYQGIDGKNYYFAEKALNEMGVKPSNSAPAKVTEPIKPAGLTPQERETVIAEINGEKITAGELYDKINSRPPAWRRMFATDAKKEEFLQNNIISEILLYNAAKNGGLEKDEVVTEARKKRMVDLLRREKFHEFKKNVKVTEDDMKKFYDENITQFKQPEGIIAAHILVKTEKEAKDIHAKLMEAQKKNDPNKGKIWRDLVKAHSLDETSKAKGGLLGDKKTRAIIKDDKNFDKAIVDAVWSIKGNGEVSAPVKTAKGWHIVKRFNKRNAMDVPFATAKKRLQRLVERQKLTDAFNAWVSELKKKYNAKVMEENIKLVTVDVSEPAPAPAAKDEKAPAAAAKGTAKPATPMAVPMGNK